MNLLLDTLASGTVACTKAVIPSPQHLALAATFLVHPTTTTRAKTAEEKEAANVALRLLRLTHTLIGPQEAKFNLAFSFTHFETSRHGGRRRVADESAVSGDSHEAKPLDLPLGQSASLWSRAEDFWHAVGWAFNCSVLYPERWERWQVWLQFMCRVLQDDWREREQKFAEMQAQNKDDATTTEERENGGKQADDLDIFRESLIFQYISENTGFGRNRRLLRAIFADGTSNSMSEFREVFTNELRQLRSEQDTQKSKARKREIEVNIDHDEYGDYLSQDDQTDASGLTDTSKSHSRSTAPPPGAKTRRAKRTRRGTRSAPDASADKSPTVEAVNAEQDPCMNNHGSVSTLGGHNSLALRQRLLNILSTVSERLPKDFTPLEELYDLFVEFIRHLPFPIFQSFVSPNVLPYFSESAQTTLCECLLFRIVESSAPETDEGYLNQAKLEKCFLPFAAITASVVDNAKMSVLLESLIMLLALNDMLSVTPDLKEAVQRGIMARAEKAQDEIRRNQTSRNLESLEWCWLLESGQRLMFLVDELLLQSSKPA